MGYNIVIDSSRSDEETTATVRTLDEEAEATVEGPAIDKDEIYEIAKDNGIPEETLQEKFSQIRFDPTNQKDWEEIRFPETEADSLKLILDATGTVDAYFTDGRYDKVSTSTQYSFDRFGTLDFSGSRIKRPRLLGTEIGEFDLTNATLLNTGSYEETHVDTMITGENTEIRPTVWDLGGVEIDEWEGYLPATTEEDDCKIKIDESSSLPDFFDRAVEDPRIEATRETREDYKGNEYSVYTLPSLDIESYSNFGRTQK